MCVTPGRECWPGGDRRAVAPGKKGTSTVCHLSWQPQPASPHFQIRKKFSSDTLLNVCPTNPEVGRDGGVGGRAVFPQYCTSLGFLTQLLPRAAPTCQKHENIFCSHLRKRCTAESRNGCVSNFIFYDLSPKRS